MILMKNRVEEILKPGVIVAHFSREAALKKEGSDPNASLYQVCGIATNTVNEEHMVIYQALYGDHEIFVRPIEEFIGTRIISNAGGVRMYSPRFSIYTDPVEVTVDAQAAGIIEKESEEIKKLRKKVKRLQNDLKKARKDSEGSLKKTIKEKPTDGKSPNNDITTGTAWKLGPTYVPTSLSTEALKETIAETKEETESK